MNRAVITVLLVSFAILTLISIATLYYTHRTPTEEKLTVTLYTYESQGTFNYIATLKPNTIYNKTTLGRGEGPVFTKITDHIEVNFTYTFQGTKPANLTVNYNVREHLETPNWTKQIGELQQKTIETKGTSTIIHVVDIPPIEISSVEDLINTVRLETGMSISRYNVTIATQMSIEANTSEGLINESFTPKLTIIFTSSMAEGDVILFESFEHSKTGEITGTDTIYQPWVSTQRNFSYVLSIVSFSGLLLLILPYAKSRPPKTKRPEALIEQAIEPFTEVISETTEEPRFKERFTTISIKTLEDLVKIADTLSKPIVHTRKSPGIHIFHVIDGTSLYEYTMTESIITDRMKKEEEE